VFYSLFRVQFAILRYNARQTDIIESGEESMRRLVLLLLVLLALAACGGGGETAADPAARAVEAYLTAKVTGDEAAIRAGLCSEMESVLERELRTFESVADARIEGMSCAADDPAAASPQTVRCTGQIVATYGTEDTTFPLAAYRAVEEDGVWRWCGETQ
jgi:predicted small lipoprotein YifL